MPHRLRDEDRFHPRIGQRGGGKGFVATFPDCPGRTAGATLIIAPKPAAGLMIRLAAGASIMRTAYCGEPSRPRHRRMDQLAVRTAGVRFLKAIEECLPFFGG